MFTSYQVPAAGHDGIPVLRDHQQQTVVQHVQHHARQHAPRAVADPAQEQPQKRGGQEPLGGQQRRIEHVKQPEQQARNQHHTRSGEAVAQAVKQVAAEEELFTYRLNDGERQQHDDR